MQSGEPNPPACDLAKALRVPPNHPRFPRPTRTDAYIREVFWNVMMFGGPGGVPGVYLQDRRTLNPNLPLPAFLRAAFHDAGTYDKYVSASVVCVAVCVCVCW